ncbi:hypothetical protein [Nocardia sp. NPDC051832]|uniref:hypothetical protein n=1 Tax=Nocardia sp. NPDC051832 TaxID=3155673 RepID=UPI003428A9F6
MGDADEHPEEALRALDAKLAATIERLRQARVELAGFLRRAAPVDVAPDMVAAGELSSADHSFVVVMSRVLSGSTLDAYKQMLQDPEHLPAGPELDELPADADERTRGALAARLLPQIRDLYAKHPGLQGMGTESRRVAETVDLALTDLYNPAQIDVMRRVGRMLRDPQTEGN